MKKILSLFLLGVAIMNFMACTEDPIALGVPTITLSSSTAQDIPGATVTVTATVTAPGGAKTLTVAGGDSQSITLSGGTAAIEQEVDIEISASAVVGSVITAVFTATDNSNQVSAPAILTITVGNPVIELTGNISADQTLDADKEYLLKGQVFVDNGKTLTIPAGTVIKGDKATKATLIVSPGGKLVANGTSTNPVIFTSSQPVGARDRGDWGGVVLLGNAWVNQTAKPKIEGINPPVEYGNITSPTTNADENSGTLTFVRIEYAGVELTPNNETNSLTLGGIGSGTTIDHIQVSFGGDDGFEWFGGNVNAKYLVSLSSWDDDFDTDFGWGGNVQFGLAVRNPFFADQSGSNGFESDNQANANDTPQGSAGYTRGTFSNMTILGPRDFNNGTGSSSNAARSISANYQNAIHIRRRTAISIFNSFISGFRIGLRVDDQSTLDNLSAGTGKHAYNILAVPGTTVIGATTSAADASFATGLSSGDATAISTYWTSNNNTTLNPTGGAPWSPVPGTPAGSIDPYTDLGITSSLFWGGQTTSNYPSNPNFAVTAGTVSTGADFSDAKLTGNAFFNNAVVYRGAFGATDWTDGWSEFQPLNVAY